MLKPILLNQMLRIIVLDCFSLAFLFYITEADDPPVTLELILNFFSGCEYPPPMGFDTTPSIHFNTTFDFPLASTCAIE